MFRNRGDFPDFALNNLDLDPTNDTPYSVPDYTYYWNGRFLIIHYDKTFLAIEIIFTFLLLILCFVVYLYAYPVSFEDPLESVKSTFLISQLVLIGLTIVFSVGAVILTRTSKSRFVLYLRLIALIAFAALFIFLGIKMHLDNKYKSENVFSDFYDKYINSDDSSQNIHFSESGLSLTTQKEAYITSSMGLYNNFSVKTYFYMGAELLLIILILILSFRISSLEEKRNKAREHDSALFDDVLNVKY